MKGELWEVEVCDSVMDAIHDGTYVVTELFIPELNLHINPRAAFLEGASRYEYDPDSVFNYSRKIRDIEFLGETTDALTKLMQSIQLKNEAEESARRLVSNTCSSVNTRPVTI